MWIILVIIIWKRNSYILAQREELKLNGNKIKIQDNVIFCGYVTTVSTIVGDCKILVDMRSTYAIY